MDHFGLSFWSKNIIYNLSIEEKQESGKFKQTGRIVGNTMIESDNDAMNKLQQEFLVEGYNKFYKTK